MPNVSVRDLKHALICSEKTAFLTKDEAKRAQHLTRKNSGIRFYVYHCPSCHCWHFTSTKEQD
jgi:NADH:ubiquinone oxidoreductase subunit F (NADH-binding)